MSTNAKAIDGEEKSSTHINRHYSNKKYVDNTHNPDGDLNTHKTDINKKHMTAHDTALKTYHDSKDKRTNKSLFFLVMAFIIIIAVIAGIYFMTVKPDSTNNTNHLVYNNFKFNRMDDNIWYVELSIKNQPYNIPFYYSPYEVENISINPQTLPAIKKFMQEHPNGRIFFAMDPYETTARLGIAGIEVARILGKRYDIFNFDVVTAFTRPYEDPNMSYPVITCRNASSSSLVIIMNIGNGTGIGYKDYCIVLQADTANTTVKVADAFAYRLLGIIK